MKVKASGLLQSHDRKGVGMAGCRPPNRMKVGALSEFQSRDREGAVYDRMMTFKGVVHEH